MSMIACTSLYGNKKLVPKEKLVFRPAAYAVIVNDGKILMVNTHSTGKYYLPGGGVEIGERIEDALRREVREETGIEIEVEKFAYLKEEFFYYDPWDEAYHSFLFFYLCKPRTFDLDDQAGDGEAEQPRWIDIQSLQAADIQSHGGTLLEILHSHYGISA